MCSDHNPSVITVRWKVCASMLIRHCTKSPMEGTPPGTVMPSTGLLPLTRQSLLGSPFRSAFHLYILCLSLSVSPFRSAFHLHLLCLSLYGSRFSLPFTFMHPASYCSDGFLWVCPELFRCTVFHTKPIDELCLCFLLPDMLTQHSA